MWTYYNLNFFNAGVNVQYCIVTRADDGFVLDNHYLKNKNISEIILQILCNGIRFKDFRIFRSSTPSLSHNYLKLTNAREL